MNSVGVENVDRDMKSSTEMGTLLTNPEVIDAIKIGKAIVILLKNVLPLGLHADIGVWFTALNHQHLRAMPLPISSRNDGVFGALSINLQKLNMSAGSMFIKDGRQRGKSNL